MKVIMTVIAIVPIKHHSSRVPGKNYRLCNGKPLFYWTIHNLLNTPEIDQIVIDTDSDIIWNGLDEQFPKETRLIKYRRPKEVQGDSVSTNLLLERVISDLGLTADFYVHTHVTNPLVSSSTFSKAINTLRENLEADSLFGVKTLYTRLYDSHGRDLNHNRFHLIPTQDLDPVYEENSCVYVFPKSTLDAYHARIGENAMLFPMSDVESTDIDWPDDFGLAEYRLSIL